MVLLESAEIGDWVREFLPDARLLDFGLPPELTLRGLPIELPDVLIPRGDRLGLVLPSFLAIAFACLSAIALVGRTSLGEVTGELVTLALVWLGLGGTAGGTVARFIGGEYSTRLRPLILLPGVSSAATRDSQGLQMRGLGRAGAVVSSSGLSSGM